MKIIAILLTLLSVNASAALVTFEYTVSADKLFSYTTFAGADGSSAAENGVYDGARLVRTQGNLRSYVDTQMSGFEDWHSTTDLRMTTLNFWGFDGRGAGWGEDFKHVDVSMVSAPTGWVDWSTGWDANWGPNPNPNTDRTAGWYVEDVADGFNPGDADLINELFTFQFTFDDTDWLYGENTFGAPNSLGDEVTMWFGGWMGNDDNAYQFIYEGNLALQGQQVPEPGVLALFGSALVLLGISRRRKHLK